MSPSRPAANTCPPPLPPGVDLHPGFLEPEEAAMLRRDCLQRLQFESPEVSLFGRRHPVPRRLAFVAPAGARYRYSGTEHEGAGIPDFLAELLERVGKRAACAFDSILVSHYRDGNDRVGWHADDESELGANPVVAILALGATRTLAFRPRGKRPREGEPGSRGPRLDVPMEDGALLVMGRGVQRHWQHSLPRRARAGERLGLGFRRLESPG